MLVGAVRRLAGQGGDPVVQLQTNFGGGKTHSMLALYHLFSGIAPTELAGIDTVMQVAGAKTLPTVRRVVLVGNKISPGNPVIKPNGTVVRTLWGELAWQLGDKKAFARLAADDEKATSPGDVLRELFNQYGPCLILIDEWVAYARQLHDQSDLPAGGFETQFTFAQVLPETYQWLLVPVQSSPQGAVEWQAFRLSGQDALAVRASKKLRGDELLLTGFAATRLRMELDRVPLWRGDHVSTKQLIEDFARYLYLPRLKEPSVLVGAMRDGVALPTWERDAFAFADSFDETAGRYRGLRCGQEIAVSPHNIEGLLVRAEAALRQRAAESSPAPDPKTGKDLPGPPSTGPGTTGEDIHSGGTGPARAQAPTRFYGSATLDPTRVGRDAGRIADEVIAHLVGLIGSEVTVTLEIDARMPTGAPPNVVRTVTENSRTLKFTSQGFEEN
jgi:hypothetical protein